jgi:tripartite-type tricarboxylate transporter receptor subunit TctC
MLKRILILAGALLVFAAAGVTHAQGYPQQTIRIVVPFAPGGTSEIVARSVAAELSTLLGVSVIVENRAGGAGTIAMSEVAKAGPDGYTLILGHVGTLAVNPYAMERQPYDVDKDFVPIALLAKVPNIFVVNADVAAKDLKEFIALAKKNPGKLNYGSAGNGSAGHLAFEYLKFVTGIDVVHVPYRGTGPQLQDLLGGRLEAASAGTPALMAHIKSGKLRPIAVGTPERIPALPDVPTVAELGYPGFETSQWYGLIGPAGLPKDVIDKLSTAINKALKSNAITTRFANDDAKAGGGSPADFAAMIKSEQERWSKVVKAAHIRIE